MMHDITQETTEQAVIFHSLNGKVSKWMKQVEPVRYSSENDWVSFDYPSEKTAAERFRERALAAGFDVDFQ